MKTYQNYIFDLYGTLVDIHTNESKASLWKNMACIFSMMGVPYTEAELKKRYRQLTGEEFSRRLLAMREKTGDKMLAEEEVELLLENVLKALFLEKGRKADQEKVRETGLVFRSLSMGYIRLYEGVPELLAKLRKAGKRIYLLSNAQRMFTEPEMKMLGICEYFDDIFYSSDYGVKKPSIYFYDALFQKHGLKKEESVMIGNEYKADILGAERYGIDSMYVFTAQSGKEADKLPQSCRKLKTISEVY